jgi:hypothetical protein
MHLERFQLVADSRFCFREARPPAPTASGTDRWRLRCTEAILPQLFNAFSRGQHAGVGLALRRFAAGIPLAAPWKQRGCVMLRGPRGRVGFSSHGHSQYETFPIIV